MTWIIFLRLLVGWSVALLWLSLVTFQVYRLWSWTVWEPEIEQVVLIVGVGGYRINWGRVINGEIWTSQRHLM